MNEEAPLTEVHVLNSRLMLSITKEISSEGGNEKELLALKFRVEQFKRLLVRKFSDHYNSEIYSCSFVCWVTFWRTCRPWYFSCAGLITS